MFLSIIFSTQFNVVQIVMYNIRFYVAITRVFSNIIHIMDVNEQHTLNACSCAYIHTYIRVHTHVDVSEFIRALVLDVTLLNRRV